MKIKIKIQFLLLLAVPGLAIAQNTPQSQSQALEFTHVTIIDATGAPAKSDMSVVVTGNRITEIGKKVRAPQDAKVVDATGKFMIPGLWDMHIHIHRHDENVLLLANGVTGIRLMGGIPEYHKMQKQIESGDILGPRYTIASRLMDGVDPTGKKLPVPADDDAAGLAEEWLAMNRGGLPRAFQVETSAQAQYAVARSKADGSEFIKIHDDLSREGYLNLVAESKKQGFIFVGHVPDGISAEEASDMGQKSIEHLRGVLLSSSTREAELRKATLEALELPADQRAKRLLEIQRMTVDSFSVDKASALVATFVKNHTWQCPTLMPEGGLKDQIARNADLMKYLPVDLRARWQQQASAARQPSSEEQEVSKKGNDELRQVVFMMQRAGVGIMSGEDVGGPGKWAGFSLHANLAEEAAAGLTPMQVLQTATINSARFMGKEKDLGTVQKGKLADLVLLDADPLQNIGNAQKINAVIVNGRLLDRQTLDKMLDDVVANNSH